MKTVQEIREEIIALSAAAQALSEAMDELHDKRMKKLKQMMALSHMLKAMDDDESEGRSG